MILVFMLGLEECMNAFPLHKEKEQGRLRRK
jgi:hypothetical protein